MKETTSGTFRRDFSMGRAYRTLSSVNYYRMGHFIGLFLCFWWLYRFKWLDFRLKQSVPPLSWNFMVSSFFFCLLSPRTQVVRHFPISKPWLFLLLRTSELFDRVFCKGQTDFVDRIRRFEGGGLLIQQTSVIREWPPISSLLPHSSGWILLKSSLFSNFPKWKILPALLFLPKLTSMKLALM